MAHTNDEAAAPDALGMRLTCLLASAVQMAAAASTLVDSRRSLDAGHAVSVDQHLVEPSLATVEPYICYQIDRLTDQIACQAAWRTVRRSVR